MPARPALSRRISNAGPPHPVVASGNGEAQPSPGMGHASGLALLCFASCEGEHRPYPNFIQQGDAASNVAPEHAEPALTPAPGASGSETIGEGARLPSPDTSTNGTSSSTPNLDVSKPAADAGARATPDGCDCSNSPAAPLCKITANGSAAQTCVECLSNADCLNVAAPRCDEQTGRCAACQSNTDCDRFSGKPYCIDSVDARCVECANDTHCADNPSGARCNMATNACVECVVDADCASPGASRCADNHCQPCANDSGGSHCGHIVRGTSVRHIGCERPVCAVHGHPVSRMRSQRLWQPEQALHGASRWHEKRMLRMCFRCGVSSRPPMCARSLWRSRSRLLLLSTRAKRSLPGLPVRCGNPRHHH
jgi:hypothetical protein